MNPKDLEIMIARYNERLSRLGACPEALGWGGGRERQSERFQAAFDFTMFSRRAVESVLDVGCGFGDFGQWLAASGHPLEYKGIDLNPALVELGRSRYGLDLSVMDVDTLPGRSFDLVVANGVFNFRVQHAHHEEYVSGMLRRFMEIARVGIAVDFMSPHVDFMHPGAFHCPEGLVLGAIRSATKRYVIRNDYLDYEYMAYAYLP